MKISPFAHCVNGVFGHRCCSGQHAWFLVRTQLLQSCWSWVLRETCLCRPMLACSSLLQHGLRMQDARTASSPWRHPSLLQPLLQRQRTRFRASCSHPDLWTAGVRSSVASHPVLQGLHTCASILQRALSFMLRDLASVKHEVILCRGNGSQIIDPALAFFAGNSASGFSAQPCNLLMLVCWTLQKCK